VAPKKLIVGNWKMNGLRDSLVEAKAIASGAADEVQAVICPPATLLAPMAQALLGSAVLLGGQDCHAKVSGAHTGDISATMLANIGAHFVLMGHSERRSDHGETNLDVQAKAAAAIDAGLMPIICVGESEAQRDGGDAQSFVLTQVAASIPGACDANQICIAYEPIWAIGTGRTPDVDDVASMHQAIRTAMIGRFGATDGERVKILYGGSVNPQNARELMAVDNVDGALVGGASLTAANFLAILNSHQ
jgi:triosephosphate isomerase